VSDSILEDRMEHKGLQQDISQELECATPTPGTAGVVQRIEKSRKKPEGLEVVKLKEAHPCSIPQY